MNATLRRTAVLFMTHFVDDAILGEYRKLQREAGPAYDVILLVNTADWDRPLELPDDVLSFSFDGEDIRNLGYGEKCSQLSSYNCELFVLNFWQANPAYDHYWAIEYDIRFSGDWSLLLRAFAGSDADLVGTTINRFEDSPDWFNWRSLKPPHALKDGERIRAFLPIYRISNRALERLHQAYRQGWRGHFEATVPTILGLAGFRLEDMGGDGEFVAAGNHNRFYRNNPRSRELGPGTLVFRPNRLVMGDEPNVLWHPVKAARAETWANSRRERLLRRAKSFVAGLVLMR